MTIFWKTAEKHISTMMNCWAESFTEHSHIDVCLICVISCDQSQIGPLCSALTYYKYSFEWNTPPEIF